MCSSWRRAAATAAAAAAVAAALALPLLAGGQGQAGPLRSVEEERRIAAILTAQMVRARHAEADEDSARFHSQLQDTVRVGRVVIGIAAGLGPLAAALAEEADSAAAALFGAGPPHPELLFTLVDVDAGEGRRRFALSRWVGRQNEETIRLNDTPVGRDQGVRFLAGGLARREFAALDSAAKQWLRSPPDPMIPLEMRLARSYVVMATSGRALATRCLGGDLEACRMATVIVEPRDPVLQWYEPPVRRAMVNRLQWLVRGDPSVPVCLRAENDEACIAVLRRIPRAELWLPVDEYVRHALLAFAIEAGGADAWRRFAESRATPIEARLAAAARVPAGDMVGRWQRAIAGARPRPVALDAGATLMAVVWGAVFLGLAMSSTRWRA